MQPTKTIAVLGATGTQGSSVVKSFSRDPSWQIRALTRNPASARAKALLEISPNIELVQADTGDKASLVSAFQNCTAIFAVTDYWAPFSDPEIRNKHAVGSSPGEALREWAYHDEIRHGKNIADAAASVAADGLSHFIWSGLPSCSEVSKGKYEGIYHFESKAAITRYIHDFHPGLASRMSVLFVGFYVSNMLKSPMMWPVKQDDGTFIVRRICNGDAKHPFIITDEDTGPLTNALVHSTSGKELLGYTAMLSWAEMTDLWAKATGRKAKFVELTLDDFKKLYPVEGAELLSATYSAEFGFAGRDGTVSEPADFGIESRPDRVEAWFRMQDWSKVL